MLTQLPPIQIFPTLVLECFAQPQHKMATTQPRVVGKWRHLRMARRRTSYSRRKSGKTQRGTAAKGLRFKCEVDRPPRPAQGSRHAAVCVHLRR